MSVCIFTASPSCEVLWSILVNKLRIHNDSNNIINYYEEMSEEEAKLMHRKRCHMQHLHEEEPRVFYR